MRGRTGGAAKAAHRLQAASGSRSRSRRRRRRSWRPSRSRSASCSRTSTCWWWTSRPAWSTHPGAGRADGTLAAAALAHAPGMAGVGGPRRPGIVHRLDKDTSGLLVLAKTQAAYDALTAQLARAHRAAGAISAWSTGRVGGPRAWSTQPIGRDPRSRLRMAVLPEGGQAGGDALPGPRALRRAAALLSSAGSRPGGRTRSASTWPRWATRSWATRPIGGRRAAPAGDARLTELIAGLAAWRSTPRVSRSCIPATGEPWTFRLLCPPGSSGSCLICATGRASRARQSRRLRARSRGLEAAARSVACRVLRWMLTMNQLTTVILAAGEAKRMRSRRPKVLHQLCGRPLIAYPVNAGPGPRQTGSSLVVGPAPTRCARRCAGDRGRLRRAAERLGTGHAVLQARVACGDGAA